MAEARQRDAWNHTAGLMCLLANIHRDRKEQRTPFRPTQFHPLELRQRPPRKPRGISWHAFERLVGLDDE